LKIDKNDVFKWAMHLPGSYYGSGFFDLYFTGEENLLYLVGDLLNGTAILTGVGYEDTENTQSTYLLKIDPISGREIGHIWLSQAPVSRFISIDMDADGNILTYLILSGSAEFLDTDLISVNDWTS
jgi:hypothetical protein